MDRKEALAGGGADGSSAFLRLPRWCAAGVETYPQNTESRSRHTHTHKNIYMPECAGRQSREGRT